MSQELPEAGERCTVQTGDGEKTAVWTGHTWAADDGATLLSADQVQSWESRPSRGELEVVGFDPDNAETPPVGVADDSEEE